MAQNFRNARGQNFRSLHPIKIGLPLIAPVSTRSYVVDRCSAPTRQCAAKVRNPSARSRRELLCGQESRSILGILGLRRLWRKASYVRAHNRSPIGHNHLPNPPKMQTPVQDWKQCVNRVERGPRHAPQCGDLICLCGPGRTMRQECGR
jgi:hypothetical protein